MIEILINFSRMSLIALAAGFIILGAPADHTRGDEPRDRADEAVVCGKIVFFGAQLKDDRDASSILAMNADGTGLEILYKHAEKGQSIDKGRISPDARTIAFTIFDQKTRKGEVWLQGSKGERRKVLDNAIIMGWSPDASKLACIGGTFGKWKNFVFDIKTGQTRTLPLPDFDHVCDWSADGKYLSVMSGRPDKTFKHPKFGDYPLRQIELIETDSDVRRPMTINPSLDNLWARFSPDGTKVAHYQREHRDGQILERSMIGDRDGSSTLVALSYNRLDENFHPKLEDRLFWDQEGPACWSPDGKVVAWLVSNSKSLSPTEGRERLSDVEQRKQLKNFIVFTSSNGEIGKFIDLNALGLAYPGEIDWSK